MKKTILFINTFLLITGLAWSQGCIALHRTSGFGQYNLAENAFSTSNWLISINNRYFKVYRDNKRKLDQKTAETNQSIVNSYSTDIGITRF